jgi:Sigma-70, region 4
MQTGIPTIASPAERRIRREARSATLRARALALRQDGWTYAAIGQALGVSLERARQIVKKAERLREARWYDALPARALFLHRRGWQHLDELAAAQAVARLSRRELMSSPNFGKGACAAVLAWLAMHGLKLSTEIEGRATEANKG